MVEKWQGGLCFDSKWRRFNVINFFYTEITKNVVDVG